MLPVQMLESAWQLDHHLTCNWCQVPFCFVFLDWCLLLALAVLGQHECLACGSRSGHAVALLQQQQQQQK
jgi:hypothetical protein